MGMSASSIAAGVGASATNVQHAASADVLARKMVIIGTYDPSITTIADEVPALVTSAEYAGATYGRGYMLHRLVQKAMLGSQNSETWVIPQAEAGGAAASTGTITASGTATAAGTIYLYISGDSVQVTVNSGDTAAAVATAIAAAITADPDLPVSAVVNGVTAEQVDVTAKSKGPWGDNIPLTTNWGFQEADVPGISLAIVAMSGGSGIPTISNALNAMGTGDLANSNHFTELAHGYGQDSTTLNAISTYNGAGNTATGCYAKTVSRPFRSLVGDIATGASGLSDLVTLANGRKTDRTNGVIPVPGSPNSPDEIAALALGIGQFVNATRAEETLYGQTLTGVIAGAKADQWTSSYDVRNTAVLGGISTTVEEGGAVIVHNVMTFYRPDSVSPNSNGYRSFTSISKIQNMLNSIKVNYSSDKWLGCSIVADVNKVANTTSRLKARDVQSVKDDAISLAKAWRDHAWIYEAEIFAIPNISVTVRAGTNGFDLIIPVILSGENWIIDGNIQFDTAITVLL